MSTAAIHVSFFSQQAEVPVSKEDLISIFNPFGVVIACYLKSCVISEVRIQWIYIGKSDGIVYFLIFGMSQKDLTQHGYAFIHFSDTPDGIQQALDCIIKMDGNIVNGLHLTCNMSEQLYQYFQEKKSQQRRYSDPLKCKQKWDRNRSRGDRTDRTDQSDYSEDNSVLAPSPVVPLKGKSSSRESEISISSARSCKQSFDSSHHVNPCYHQQPPHANSTSDYSPQRTSYTSNPYVPSTSSAYQSQPYFDGTWNAGMMDASASSGPYYPPPFHMSPQMVTMQTYMLAYVPEGLQQIGYQQPMISPRPRCASMPQYLPLPQPCYASPQVYPPYFDRNAFSAGCGVSPRMHYFCPESYDSSQQYQRSLSQSLDTIETATTTTAIPPTVGSELNHHGVPRLPLPQNNSPLPPPPPLPTAKNA